MRDSLKRFEVWIFLVLIVIENTLFIRAIVEGILPQRAYNMGRFALLGSTLALVVFAFRGLAGLKSLVASLGVWRVHPLWFLFVFCWAPSISVLVLSVKSLITGQNEFTLTFWALLQPGGIRTLLIAALVGEIVWVNYGVDTLSKRFGLLPGAAIVGFFWTAWWVPIAIYGAGVIPELPIIPLFFGMTGIALMCGFIYHNTHSGPVVLLLQIMVNLCFLILPIVPTNGGEGTYLAFSLTYLGAVLLLYLLFGPRPLFGRPVLAGPALGAR